jgi:hypothetical protein
MLVGSYDSEAASGPGTASKLMAAGFDVEYVELEGVNHEGVITPERAPSVVDHIFEVAGR